MDGADRKHERSSDTGARYHKAISSCAGLHLRVVHMMTKKKPVYFDRLLEGPEFISGLILGHLFVIGLLAPSALISPCLQKLSGRTASPRPDF